MLGPPEALACSAGGLVVGAFNNGNVVAVWDAPAGVLLHCCFTLGKSITALHIPDCPWQVDWGGVKRGRAGDAQDQDTILPVARPVQADPGLKARPGFKV